MTTGDKVLWCGKIFTVLLEYDHEHIYLAIGDEGAQLVHVSELEMVEK